MADPKKFLDEAGTQSVINEVKTRLATKAPLDSPAFSGTPTVPDLGAGAASNQAANKKAVDDAITAYDGTWARITSAELAEMWGD